MSRGYTQTLRLGGADVDGSLESRSVGGEAGLEPGPGRGVMDGEGGHTDEALAELVVLAHALARYPIRDRFDARPARELLMAVLRRERDVACPFLIARRRISPSSLSLPKLSLWVIAFLACFED